MHRPYRIRAVLFDFDGTLTRPGAIDFPLIRTRIGCPPEIPVLEFITGLADAEARRLAELEVHRQEMKAAAMTKPNAGAESLIEYLRAKGVKLGVISRNSRAAIERALGNFERTGIESFDLIISRDMPLAPKPSPDGIVHAAEFFDVGVEEILVVGDFVFDIAAGNRAGALSAYITNGEKKETPENPDFIIHHLPELISIVDMGIGLKGGKLPQKLLDTFLQEFSFSDHSVLNWPGVGEDTAAVEVGKEEILVITSDPITFATEAIGEYAVLVNANDIVTSGGTPRWLLTTLLFPVGTAASEIRAVMAELAAVCSRCHITLCGGHTEITDGVSRAIINGMMIGTVSRDRFLDKKDMRPGDRILLTKGVAVEGTALIAREFAGQLAEAGVERTTIERAKSLISRISVIEEAKIAAAVDGVTALHDITEGGIATALEEFSIAGGYGLAIDLNRIPILPETEAVCAPFEINPLGLIGSGSLLICCRTEGSDRLLAELESAGIEAAVIGSVMDEKPGIVAEDGQEVVDWPRFTVDEITRLFGS